MQWTSIAAILFLFFIMSFILVLPFGVRTSEEVGAEPEPGHAESAPHSFSFGRVARRASLLALVLFGLYYLNYVNGWITADTLDWVH